MAQLPTQSRRPRDKGWGENVPPESAFIKTGRDYRVFCQNCKEWRQSHEPDYRCNIWNIKYSGEEGVTTTVYRYEGGTTPRKYEVREENITVCGRCDNAGWKHFYKGIATISFLRRHGYEYNVQTTIPY